MSLLGNGAVAIWHDIAPEGRGDFYAWHGKEHMLERVGIPGFLRGRRYVAIDADLEFFNLYEAVSPAVLTGPDYLGRLNTPTPWTRAAVVHFKKVSRSLCRVAASVGAGQGGLASTWRYDVPDEQSSRHVDDMLCRLLPSIIENGSIAGAHLLAADAQASAVHTAEQKARVERNLIPRWILIVEGWGDKDDFVKVCGEAFSSDVLMSAGASGPADVGLYQLQATITHADLDAKLVG